MISAKVVSAKAVGVTTPLITEIPDAEGLIAYAARVSNPSNQTNFDTAAKLLEYCAKHNHWSVFEMANLVIEVEAPRDISRQILRHKTASFQEFSQRYAEATQFVIREARLQDTKNRQNSVKTDDEHLQKEWEKRQQLVIDVATKQYQWALENGIAKECARVVLPEGNTMSRLYMNATVRTWMHYINLRSANGTQEEHCEVAKACREEFLKYFPSLLRYVNG